MISVGELQSIVGCSAELSVIYTPIINELLTPYGIVSRQQLSMFIAQIAHESGGFKRTVENLNYNSQGLLSTWHSRYTQQLALQHHRKPKLIANHVYGNRMGNSKQGDGWKYRGRGLIQLTGFNNYKAFQDASGVNVVDNHSLLEQPRYAVESAMWFWKTNNLNKFADVGDLRGCTRIINGGYNGMADRESLYNKAKEVLSWS